MRRLLLLPRAAAATPSVALGVVRHGLFGESARVAYFLFLSIFPLLLILFALTGYWGGDAAFRLIMRLGEYLVPAEGARWLETFGHQVTSEHRPGVLSAGLLLAAWSASGVFAALCESLNRVHGVVEGRSWFRRRLLSILVLTVTSALLLLSGLGLLVAPGLLKRLGVPLALRVLNGSVIFVLASVTLYLILYLLPDRDLSRHRPEVAVAALIGCGLWFVLAALLRVWVVRHGFREIYGVVGGVIALLLWVYLSAFTILVAGEFVAALTGGAKRGRR